ncbi:MAG: ATP synthase F1 subunit gamma [Deltaproteobacteria bacterium]|nr:MAG: ATP synthase F1 subunit gamma [Deltaproteobacteria bacterium]
MATLRTIRKRIITVQKTSKITKAMKMVSAAKLRRAQEAIENLRPYATAVEGVVASLAARSEKLESPFLQPRAVKHRLFVPITSDRGLCGGFNNTLNRRLEYDLEARREAGETFSLFPIGRKALEYFRKRGYTIRDQITDYQRSVDHAFAVTLAGKLIDAFLSGEVDEVHLVYNVFVSAMTQRYACKKILPIEVTPLPEGSAEEEGEATRVDYIYEPKREALLSWLLPRFVETEVFRALLESLAGEHGARMTAMDSATNNAVEMIDRLTLQMNRARQAAITSELMDIVNGAEAIK